MDTSHQCLSRIQSPGNAYDEILDTGRTNSGNQTASLYLQDPAALP